MKYFLGEWDKLKHGLGHRHLALFLDYDGTLAPFADTPDQALMTQETREALTGLSKLARCHLAIISGRKLSDLKHRIAIPNITYVGNHGFEMEGANLNFKSLISTQYLEDLAAIRDLLKAKLFSIDGIRLEDKEIGAAVHFRLAGDKGISVTRKIFMNVCRDYLSAQRISIMEGENVLEVRPPIQWSKGEAALWLLAKWQRQSSKDQMTALYAGDDRTDEDAFKMLGGIAVTIKVGDPKGSRARYYLRTQEEVLILLRQILALEDRCV